MKTYRVTVNGTTYEVEVEQVGGAVNTAAAAPTVSAAPEVKQAAEVKAPIAPKAAPAASGGQSVTAPMPGTILKVNAAQGKAFKKGDSLLVLEAMKMENDIVAPCDCTITSVCVSQGASVSTGDVLVTYQE